MNINPFAGNRVSMQRKAGNRMSRNMFLILFIVVLSIVCNILFVHYQTGLTEYDTEVVSYLSLIRGNIQRIAKLELAGLQDDGLILDTNKLIYDFYKDKIILKGENKDLDSRITSLTTNWSSFKSIIYLTRENSNEINKTRLVDASDDLWDQTNALVLLAQKASQRKIRFFDLVPIILLFNLVLVLQLILMTKSYVKDKLEYQVSHDPLTKIFNRRFLYEYCKNEIHSLKTYENLISVIFFDIDHFKNVNDKYGHDKGDYVLIELTKIVQKAIRKNDILARFGGEEFMIVSSHTDIDTARIMAERLRKVIETHPFAEVGQVTVSVGVTDYHEGDTLFSLFKRADKALYMSKENGRNKISVL